MLERKYLKRIQSYALCYIYVDNLGLICHKDADLGGCVDDRMSTSSNIFMLAGEALSR